MGLRRSKWRMSIFIGILIMICALTSCAPSSRDQVDTAETDPSALSFIDYTREGDGTGCGDGYYRLIPRSDCSNNICFVDYQQHQQVYLCSRPECLHQDETCTSWLPYGAGGGALFAAGDHLYYFSFGNRDLDIIEALGEDALPQIIQMDRNGANRKVLYTFSPSEVIRKGICYDQNAIYFTCDSFENFEKNNYLPESILYQYSTESGELTKLQTLPVGKELIGVNGRCLVFTSCEDAWNIAAPASELQSDILLYNVDTAEEHQILSHPFTSLGRVFGGVYYLYDPHTLTLSEQELVPGSSLQVIRGEIFDAEFTGYPDNVKTIFDGHLFIVYEIPNSRKSEYLQNMFAVDLSTGKSQQIDLSVGNFTSKPVDIVDETAEYFLVISSVDFEDVHVPFSGGSLTMEYPYYNYALIRKSDYYASKPNYILIETVA